MGMCKCHDLLTSQGQKLHSQNILKPLSFEHVSHEEACSLVEPAQSDNLVSPVSNHLSPHSPCLRPSPSCPPTPPLALLYPINAYKNRKGRCLGPTPYWSSQNPQGWAQASTFFQISLDDSEVQSEWRNISSGDKKWSRKERIREVEPVRKCQKFPSKEFLSSYPFSDKPMFLDPDTGEREREREREREKSSSIARGYIPTPRVSCK